MQPSRVIRDEPTSMFVEVGLPSYQYRSIVDNISTKKLCLVLLDNDNQALTILTKQEKDSKQSFIFVDLKVSFRFSALEYSFQAK